jgi:hypothetical protein
MSLVEQRLWDTQVFGRANGLNLQTSGGSNLNVLRTAGNGWFSLNDTAYTAFDTSGADLIDRYFGDDTAGWQVQGNETEFENQSFYNGAGGLNTLGNGRYGTRWFYFDLTNGDVSMVYGTSNAKESAEALLEAQPSTLPSRLDFGVQLLGRMIIQKDAGAVHVSDVWDTSFSTSSSGGENNSGANVGTGSGVYKQKNGTVLEFNSILGTSGIVNSLVGDDVQLSGDALLPRDGTRSMLGKLDMGGFDVIDFIKTVGTASDGSLQEFLSGSLSAGRIIGGEITLVSASEVQVGLGEGLLRAIDDPQEELQSVGWVTVPTTTIALNTVLYFGIEWNAGAPQVVAKGADTWDYRTEFPLGSALRDSTGLHITNNPQAVGDAPGVTNRRFYETLVSSRDARTGGLILGESGTRNMTLSAGAFWSRLNRISIAATDTSVSGSVDFYYGDGGSGFNVDAGRTQWPNAQFDDGSGTLANLSNGNYGVLWFSAGYDGDLVAQYGRASHNKLQDAEEEPIPANIPLRIDRHTIPVGRYIFREGESTTTSIDSVFDLLFRTTGVSSHSDLTFLEADDHLQYLTEGRGDLRFLKLDGTSTMAGALAMGGFDLTNPGLVDGIDVGTDVPANTTHRGLTTGNPHAVDMGQLAGAGFALDDIAAWDGSKFTPAQIPEVTMGFQLLIMIPDPTTTKENAGTIIAVYGHLPTGAVGTIDRVRLDMKNAPDSAVIVDVHKGTSQAAATTIFTTQGNRPQIATSALTGVSVAPDVTTVSRDDIFYASIDQAASAVAGDGVDKAIYVTIQGTALLG